MNIKSTDLTSLFEKALSQEAVAGIEEIGMVMQVGDGICRVSGLTDVLYGELVHFDGGNQGIVFNLDEDFVSIFLLFNTYPVLELELVRRTHKLFEVPVGDGLLGRIINALGKPLDSLGDIPAQEYRALEHPAPGVMDRTPINRSMSTGILSVDALVPVGRGQRELIIGNRGTGKSALALNAIINQRGQNVVCIYVSIGQRQANVARFVQQLQEHGALEYTIIVSAEASDPVLCQYNAPYTGCTIAEYFCDQGKDVLIVYDDLTNHAVAYREMSLLLRRAPGREAYPGDVFYLHSRLLERAGRMKGKGSITALPIVQIQNDDITAYIPTNLISITDGQIFLDTKLFNQGIRPAVNVELSVSRVGSAAQTSAIKKMTRSLRLELAQYQELLAFAQFGTELDEVSQQRLARGACLVELLKQDISLTYNFVDESLMLFLFNNGFLDALPTKSVNEFARQFVSFVSAIAGDVYEAILTSETISDDQKDRLISLAQEFMRVYEQDSQG
jgi:F-type H+-transporting ATPase subunit alpha